MSNKFYKFTAIKFDSIKNQNDLRKFVNKASSGYKSSQKTMNMIAGIQWKLINSYVRSINRFKKTDMIIEENIDFLYSRVIKAVFLN